jgi:O-antigen/teichoic acid export membrane protein
MLTTFALGAASGPILARGLGVGGRGEFEIATLVYQLVPLVIGCSLGVAVVALPRNLQLSTQAFWKLTTLTWAVAVAVGGVLCLSDDSPLPKVCVVLLAVSYPFYLNSQLVVGLLQRQKKFRTLAIATAIDVGGSSIVVVVLFMLHALTVTSGVTALLATTVFSTCYMLFRSNGISVFFSLESSRETSAFLRQFVWHYQPGALATALFTRVDLIFVALVVGRDGLGLYSVAVSVASLANLLPTICVQVALPYVSHHAGGGSPRRAMKSVAITSVVVTTSGIAAAVALGVVGTFALRVLFGPSFMPARSCAVLLFVSTSFLGAASILEALLAGAGHPAKARNCRLVGLLVLLFGMAILELLHDTGITRVALVSAGSAVMCTVMFYRYVWTLAWRGADVPSLATVRATSHAPVRSDGRSPSAEPSDN